MTLFTLIIVLVLEQIRPLPAERLLYRPIKNAALKISEILNAGALRHAVLAWITLVGFPVIITAGIYWLIYRTHPWLALAFNVLVLYYTMGFRHVSHYFTRIHAALRTQDLALARELLGQWRGHLHDQSPRQEVARLTIEEGLIASHRQVFALIVWFILLPGPSGAVLYRFAHIARMAWSHQTEPKEFGRVSRRAFAWIDWLPTRVTAMAFSVVGDFEDAAYCWRMQSGLWPNRNDGILLAAGGGALGVRLGQPIHETAEKLERPEMGMGDEADVDHLQSLIGLIRRCIILYALILLLVAIAGLAN